MNTRNAERGQILPFVALAFALLMGFAAFAIDLGYLRYQQRLQQTAADSAALAADWALYGVSNPTNSTCGSESGAGAPASVCAAGQNAARNNSFSSAFNSAMSCSSTAPVCVTINYPPQSGAYQGNTNAVEAIVHVSYPGFFAQFLGSSTNWVSTRAVAVIETSSASPCIVVTERDLTVNAGARVTSPCGISVAGNVNASSADLIDAPSVTASGSVSCSQPSPCPASTIVTSGVPPFPDPCATVPGCAALTAAYPLNSTPTASPYYSGDCTTPSKNATSLSPGFYCSFSPSGDVNLSPGLYVFSGDFTANNLTCTGCVSGTTGVTIVLGGKVKLNGATTSLNAPPPWQGAGPATVSASMGAPGVLFYQTSTTTSPENFSGQSLLGMVYAPNAHINLNAASSLTVSFIVAADIVANGSTLTVSAPASSGGYTQVPTLAE